MQLEYFVDHAKGITPQIIICTALQQEVIISFRVKVKMKLRFSVPSAGITEIEQTLMSL